MTPLCQITPLTTQKVTSSVEGDGANSWQLFWEEITLKNLYEYLKSLPYADIFFSAVLIEITQILTLREHFAAFAITKIHTLREHFCRKQMKYSEIT